jgi:sterol desaturase/sphingolipid hydroxylase (fatty acid hydroxylase superfamily)
MSAELSIPSPTQPVLMRGHWLLRLLVLATSFIIASYVLQLGMNVASTLSAREPLHLRMLWFDPFDLQDLGRFYAAPVLAIIGLELILVGWTDSSLRRLVCAPSVSAMTDWAFVLLMASGLYAVLITLSGLGLYYYVGDVFGWPSLQLFADWPLWAALPAVYVCRSFVNYWLHRLQHSRWLWPLHKTHHAAREFTSVNYLRAHPIEVAWQNFAYTFVLTAIGFPADAIVAFEVIANIQQLLSHSNATVLAPLERLGFVTAAGHRVHHGIEDRFHNRNFGELFNIWDRLFGTYHAPSGDVHLLAIGVEEREVAYNTERLLPALWAQVTGWGRALRAEWGASVLSFVKGGRA